MAWVWFGYELQRVWVFRVDRARRGFVKYLTNQLAFAGLTAFLLWLLVDVVGIVAEVAYLICVAIITLGVYLSATFWIFSPPKEAMRGRVRG